MTHRGMKYGIFLAPFHRVGENPTLAIDRDMELIEWLDYLGYDEVWIGEHHSAGWELIASPEIMIAAAAPALSSPTLTCWGSRRPRSGGAWTRRSTRSCRCCAARSP